VSLVLADGARECLPTTLTLRERELAPESRPAADPEPSLHGAILLAVTCRPGEDTEDHGSCKTQR